MNTIILSAIAGVLMMFSGIFIKNKSAYKNISIALLTIIAVMNIAESYGFSLFNVNTYSLLAFSKKGLFFNTICIVATLLYVIINGSEIEKVGSYVAEYFALIMFVVCGIAIVTSYQSLLMLFIGIEIISIPLYILTGSAKSNLNSNEAALKYFLMGAFSTGIMLMGIAFIYGANGSFALEKIVSPIPVGISLFEASGILLIMIAMAFKVSAAPFHFWTPDVYDGAPTVFTSFMATVVKVAGFVAFIRLFESRFGSLGSKYQMIIAFLIVATLFIGNITAVFQQSVKRMLAYSSIAQAGFMLFAIFALNQDAIEGMILYATAYSLATIGIFAVLARMEDHSFMGFYGMGKSHPLIAITVTICLLSLAGIPLTAGFFSKYFMLAAALKVGKISWLVIVAIIFAAISVYYYFRVIQSMYFKDGEAVIENVNPRFKFLLVFISVIIILLGIFPNLLLHFYYF